MIDLGLLGAMINVKPKEIIVENKLFTEYKGAFTEQFVQQQLISMGIKPYYYSNSSSTVELVFVV